MKRIKLTQGKFALVDDDMFDYLNQWKWQLDKHTGYVKRHSGNKNYRLHQLVKKAPIGLEIDHKDRNKLNNQSDNLRIVTISQNRRNINLKTNNTSGHMGVSWDKKSKKWRANVTLNRKQISLGFYKSIQIAILARKWGERLYYI